MPIGPAPVISTSSPTRLNGQCHVRRVAERIEDRGDVVSDRVAELERVEGRDHEVLGEAALAVQRRRLRGIAAEVAAAGPAVAAISRK